jgi:hypothetical protein
LNYFPASIVCLFFAVFSILLSFFSHKVVKRLFHHTVLKDNKDAITNYVNVLSILYSIVLAFIVISAWENYEKVEETMENEANAVANVYHYLNVFPDTTQNRIQGEIKKYVSLVIKEDWEKQQWGKESEEADNIIHGLGDQIHPKTPEELQVYPLLIEQINYCCIYRRMRVSSAAADIPLLIWSILLIGALVLIFLSSFFYLEHSILKKFLSGTLSAFIFILLFIAFALSNPYKGSTKLKPEPFEELISHTFKHRS